ncbi:hypothetical protein HK096_007342, partial [Nowakowskiella sp. JEL0078]
MAESIFPVDCILKQINGVYELKNGRPWRINLMASSRTSLFVADFNKINCHMFDPFSYRILPAYKVISLEDWGSNFAINAIRRNEIGSSEVLVSVDDGGNVFVFFTSNLHQPPLHFMVEESAWGIAVHGPSHLLAISANSHNINLFDLSILKNGHHDQTLIELISDSRKVLKGHCNNVPSIDFSGCGNFLTSSSIDSSCIIWHVKTGKILRRKRISEDWGWCARFVSPLAFNRIVQRSEGFGKVADGRYNMLQANYVESRIVFARGAPMLPMTDALNFLEKHLQLNESEPPNSYFENENVKSKELGTSLFQCYDNESFSAQTPFFLSSHPPTIIRGSSAYSNYTNEIFVKIPPVDKLNLTEHVFTDVNRPLFEVSMKYFDDRGIRVVPDPIYDQIASTMISPLENFTDEDSDENDSNHAMISENFFENLDKNDITEQFQGITDIPSDLILFSNLKDVFILGPNLQQLCKTQNAISRVDRSQNFVSNHFDRICFMEVVEDLGLVVIASQKGKIALARLARIITIDGILKFAMHIEQYLPTDSIMPLYGLTVTKILENELSYHRLCALYYDGKFYYFELRHLSKANVFS